MNKILLAFTLLSVSIGCRAANNVTSGGYFGLINNVAVGFFGHVGIELPAGETCHGSAIVVLLTSNTQYKEILSTLLAAKATNQVLSFYNLGAQTTTFGDNYCVVTAAALGDFSMWHY